MVWCSDKPCRFLAVFNQLHIKIFDFGLSPEVIDKEDVSKTLHLFLSKSFFFWVHSLCFTQAREMTCLLLLQQYVSADSDISLTIKIC